MNDFRLNFYWNIRLYIIHKLYLKYEVSAYTGGWRKSGKAEEESKQ